MQQEYRYFMILNKLSVVNFKNIRTASLDFSPKLNCLIGSNGMGKTNILDAVYYLSFCRSAFNPVDSQVITHGEEFMVLTGIQTLPELKEFAETIRLQVEKTPMAGHKLTCSLGITLWQTEADTTAKLFKRVDDALYQAKKNGRNCVMVQLQ